MPFLPLDSAEALFLGYVLVFGIAALASFAGAYRTRRIADADTRHGLLALLLASGGWAAALVGTLLVPTTEGKLTFHMAGLVVGFASVWAWLYFCSAYTGRSLHRNRTIRRLSLGLFFAVLLSKLSNPLHHLYFTTELTSVPFHHLAVHNHLLYWVTFGLSCSLAAVGLFILLDFFMQVPSGKRPLGVLAGLTVLPVFLNAIGHTSPLLLDVSHEPLGVAAFAVGILFFYADQFRDTRLSGGREAPALVLGRRGQVRTYNDHAAALFPALEQEGATGNALDAISPELAEARAQPHSTFGLQRGGRRRYFRVSESRLGTGPVPLGRLLVLTEVTDQKKREEMLRDAKNTAEEASRLKSAILSKMRHEIRTPLTSVISFAGVLKNNLSGSNARYAELVHRGGERLMSTLDSVIRLSKLEAGTVELDREHLDLATIVQKTVELLEPKVEDADLTLRTILPSSPVTGYWDEDGLYHVVKNLLENAIKFTPEEGRIEVRVRQEGDEAVLEVDDTGVGIGEEVLPDIFDAFKQESDGPAREYDGSGLGLSIVQKLTEAMGGRITVESEKGAGSCFTVRLPTEPDDESLP